MVDSRTLTRAAELDLIRPYIDSNAVVLEIGGGTGFQAQRIASWGARIRSIDVVAASPALFPVTLYDGVNIPSDSASFDVIFSSNVLEHVEDLPALFVEMKRVLKSGGVMVHVVPSAAWRFWTSVAHYPYLFRRLLLRSPGQSSVPTAPALKSKPSFMKYLRALFPVAHGCHASAAGELFDFSRWGWRRRFADAGFTIAAEFGTGIWYTGYRLSSSLGLGKRQALAKALGSACRVFVLRSKS